MQLSIPFLKKKQDKIFYFCLYITDTILSGFVLDVEGGKEIIIASRKITLSSGYDKLLEDIDTLISELELQSSSTLSKTIFFLNSNMIDPSTHDIKEPYKEQIKKISKELELEPLGYIDVKESMEDYVKGKAILNCVIVELNKAELGIFVYKGGALIHSQYIVRTEDVGANISTALSTIPGKQILPSKMLIYGEADNTKAVADIAQYNWDEKIFVQHPTIETLKEQELNQALAHSFSKELGNTETTTSVSESTAFLPPESAAETGSSFGFVFGQDILSSGIANPGTTNSGESSKLSNSGSGNILSSFSEKFSSITSGFKPMSTSLPKQKGILVIGGALVILAGLFFAYEYFVHKVTLKVYVQSKSISDELDITLPVSESEKDTETALLKHVSVQEFTNEKNTTGTRDVGQKAKGEVVIHNFDNKERTIQRGTEIMYKELRFSLDSDVKVASSSGVTSEGTKQSGKAKAEVTASEIGEDYNLDKGKQLTVDSLPDSLFIAIVDSAFTGGSMKKVNTVSKADMDALESLVEKDAKAKSKDQLSKEITKDELLIPDLTEVIIADASFTKEVGEEAEKVGIKASSEIEYYTINKKGLLAKLKEGINSEDTKGYVLDEKSIDFDVEDVDIEDEEATITLNTKAKLFKEIDDSAIKSAVSMKQMASIENILSDKFSVSSVEIDSTTPNLPLFNSWTPFFKKNISILTSSK